jgi:hypothetical protein
MEGPTAKNPSIATPFLTKPEIFQIKKTVKNPIRKIVPKQQ